jgi:hypothetical protein
LLYFCINIFYIYKERERERERASYGGKTEVMIGQEGEEEVTSTYCIYIFTDEEEN